MSKKTIIIILSAVVALITIVSICAILLFAPSQNTVPNDGTAGTQSEQNMNMSANNTAVVGGGDSIVPDDSSSKQDTLNNGNASSQSDGSQSGAQQDSSSSSGDANSTTSSIVTPEKENAINSFVSDSFRGTSGISGAVTSVDAIPSVSRNDDNWVYLAAQGGDISALLGGAERVNVTVEKILPVSSTPAGDLFKVEYTFTAHHTEAMDASAPMDRNGKSTAVIRLNGDEQVVEYTESLEWL